MFINDLFLKEAEVNHNTSSGTGSSIISSNPDGYASEEDDQSILKLSDLRKTRLTLGQLNKLRKMSAIVSEHLRIQADMHKYAATAIAETHRLSFELYKDIEKCLTSTKS